jgi:type I restriction enzyme S subunit
MGHIQRRDLDVAVVVPDERTLSKLDAICAPLWDRALRAEMESLRLVALRDTMLPRLLSGHIRVREAEELMGGSA